MGIIHSKNYSIRKILFKKIFIQKVWKLFIQKNYSFFWKIDYRPGLVKTQPHWASVEQRLRSAGNCFPVRVESVWREAAAGGLSLCKARRWIWLELDCWGCFQNWVSGVVFEASWSAKLASWIGLLVRTSSFNSKLPNPTFKLMSSKTDNTHFRHIFGNTVSRQLLCQGS